MRLSPRISVDFEAFSFAIRKFDFYSEKHCKALVDGNGTT